MTTIVCAIRGGEASRRTQEHAIQRARANGDRLIYFYVVDLDSLGEIGSIERQAALTELAWLGRVLLRMAQRRAAQAGVQAETFIGYGPVRQAIEHYLKTEKVDLFLIGAPRHTTAPVIFMDDDVEKFARSIEERTGVKMEVIR